MGRGTAIRIYRMRRLSVFNRGGNFKIFIEITVTIRLKKV